MNQSIILYDFNNFCNKKSNENQCMAANNDVKVKLKLEFLPASKGRFLTHILAILRKSWRVSFDSWFLSNSSYVVCRQKIRNG
jgi:hypothetical protein